MAIRRYLLGIGSLPVGAVVKVTAATDMITQGISDFPGPCPGQGDAMAFTFITFGLVFDVIIGNPRRNTSMRAAVSNRQASLSSWPTSTSSRRGITGTPLSTHFVQMQVQVPTETG